MPRREKEREIQEREKETEYKKESNIQTDLESERVIF